MFLTPKDIHDKTFKRSFKGYDENEVDEFLDLIIKEFNMLIDENERLRQEVSTKPAASGGENSNASLNEIMRLEAMLKQVADTVSKNAQVQYVYSEKPSISIEEQKRLEEQRRMEEEQRRQEEEAAAAAAAEAAARAAEEQAKAEAEAAQKAKLEEHKRNLDQARINFEKMVEEQRKQMEEQYRQLMGQLNGTVPDAAEEPSLSELPLEPAAPEAFPAQQPQPVPEPEKPQFFIKPEENPQMIRTEYAEPQAKPEQPFAAQTEPSFEAPAKEAQPAEPQYTAVQHQPPIAAPQAKPQFLNWQPQPAQEIPQQQPVNPEPPKAPQSPVPQSTGSGFTIKREGSDENTPNSDNRFKPNYSEYEWLYKEKDLGDTDYNTEAGTNFDITFRNPREKEELKRLIDEVID